MAVFGTNVAWGDTVEQAIAGLFGGEAGDGGGSGGDTPSTPDQPTEPNSTLEQQLAVAIAEIQSAYAAGQEALTKSDFTAYGAAQQRLATAIAKAQQLAGQLGTALPTTAPSPTPSPTPSASGG